MRGGTSKGLFFRKEDLPSDVVERDALLLSIMGSPDARQIDGMGGAHPLTSKVAIVSPSDDNDADVDYLFLQVTVDRPIVSDGQNCGNLLAGVGPYAIENGLVQPSGDETTVRVRMTNSGGIAVLSVQTPNGQVNYEGSAQIDGVPRAAAPIFIDFADVAGSSCGSLLPTGRAIDEIDGIAVTCIDNGMPVVLLNAKDVDKTGYESPGELESDALLKERIESLRLRAGKLMNLGDVTEKTAPKMCLIALACDGGAISTRTFIPHRVHNAIGVLGAASVAAACRVQGSVCDGIALVGEGGVLEIEHPSGRFAVDIEIEKNDNVYSVRRSALLRTARKLMDGHAYVQRVAS